MEYVRLGSSGPMVSRVGFGCWAAGGHGWGKVDDRDSIKAIRKALDLGVNLFDTADVYGFGHSEEILAEALGSHRHDAVVATKVGVTWTSSGEIGKDLSGGYIRRALEDSLRRLKLESIPIYQIHWPDPATNIGETMSTLAELRDQGKIVNIGVSNFSREQLEAACSFPGVVSLQAPISLISRESPELLGDCRTREVGVVAYGALAQGLFSGKYDARSSFPDDDIRSRYDDFKGERYRKNLDVLERVKVVAARHGRSPAQTALRWVFDGPGADSVLAGAKQAQQIVDDCGALGWSLPDLDMEYLENGSRPEAF